MPHETGRLGGDLLSHVLRRSTIGAEAFHGRVRDGIGCFAPRHGHQASQSHGVCVLRRHLSFGTADLLLHGTRFSHANER